MTARAATWGATPPHGIVPSPWGPLGVWTNDQGIEGLGFIDPAVAQAPSLSSPPVALSPLLAEVTSQLGAYAARRLRVFSLPLAPRGTEFQRRVWAALRAVPFGQTRSYAQLAAEVGSVARAVGSANGDNPIAIVIPCHRIIGADGDLVGYAGGLARKRALLEHEGAAVTSQGRLF